MGDPEFSKARGGIMILAPLSVACYIIYGVADRGRDRCPGTLPRCGATSSCISNSQNLSGSQTDGHEVHEVYGCETLPCTEQNTVTFRGARDLVQRGLEHPPSRLGCSIPATSPRP